MKVVSIQQLERDLDRILDDVLDQQEHYSVSISFVTCANTDNDPCTTSQWEQKSIVMLPEEDYNVMREIYTEWLQENGFPLTEID
tara:strand:- start:743 stop:997 length:255 start_codon:yes stop_codon:yes gene_type:complete